MIDVIDTALLAQNDAGGMAAFNELALAMAGGGEGALESALRGHAANRGDDLTLGQLLKDALHGGASLGSMAALDVLGGLRAVDSGGDDLELATMSLFYSDGGDDGGESDDVDGDGQPDEPIPVTGKRPNDVDEDDDDDGWLPPSGGGDGGEDSWGDGPGGSEVIADETPCVDQKPAGTDLGKLNDMAKLTAIKLGNLQDDTGWEWGALIYRGADGNLYVTPPFTSQDYDSLSVAVSLPGGSHVVGYVHTHPVSDNTDDRRPSPEDRDFLNQMSNDSSGTVTGDPNMLLYVVTKDQPLGTSPDYKTYVYDKSEWDGDDPGCTL